MKIGIMTFWWSEDNYGQLLQCYALQKYLRDAGHDAYLIRYDPRGDYVKSSIWRKMIKVFNPAELYKFLLNKKRKIIDKYEKNSKSRKFEYFRNKYIKYSDKIYYSYKELVDTPPFADIYIAGSDQVWNIFNVPTKRAINVLRAFFLDFGDSSIKRISYAASFGKEKLEDDFVKEVSPMLKKLDFVSVRERSGLEICKQCEVDNAEYDPDPTMLFDIDVYQGLCMEEKYLTKPDKPYCFLYLVGNDPSLSIQTIYNWAKKKNIIVVYISANLQQSNYKKIFPTIPEWIYLLKSAECVITNSYHCTIFSLLFKKQVGVIPRSSKKVGSNSRFEDIFQLFGLKNMYINFDNFVLESTIDWHLVSNIFLNIRNKCKFNEVIYKVTKEKKIL